MVRNWISAIALAASTLAPAYMARANDTATTATQHSPQAMTLARVIIPFDLFIAQNRDSFVYGFDATTKNDAQAQALFAAYPGVREAIIATQLAELESALTTEHPVLLDRFATHFEQAYTPAEIVTISNFLQTPLGQKVLRLEYKSIDQDQMLKAVTNGDGLTKSESDQLNAHVPQKIFMQLTPAERIQSTKFWMSATGRKLNANSANVQEIVRLWLNGVTEQFEKSAAESLINTVREFIETADAKAASS